MILIKILGYILIWAATDVGRKDDSKIEFMKSNWWLIFILITIGIYLINV